MGDKQSKSVDQEPGVCGIVDFSSFEVLRSIGKGSFGKVCIVKKKRNTDQIYAMKYMNKLTSWKQGAIENILRELHILSKLQHPFLVNLWFTFQDEEDIFMVSDLLLGGDLRYHINKNVAFNVDDVRIYLCEMAAVLDYLKSKNIIHRDIKPDNILLDEKGHLHLTDFNVATVLSDSHTHSFSYTGTKPYTAPEMHMASLRIGNGYDYSVDWWSLGVTVYEILRHKRPFNINHDTTSEEIIELLKEGSISFPVDWPHSLRSLLFDLFQFEPKMRIGSFNEMAATEFCENWKEEDIIALKIDPQFQPSKSQLNYDPTYELEEMIIESNPLHKKKQRLQKRQKQRERLKKKNSKSSIEEEGIESPEEKALREINEHFIPFNRETLSREETPTTSKLEKELANSQCIAACADECTDPNLQGKTKDPSPTTEVMPKSVVNEAHDENSQEPYS